MAAGGLGERRQVAPQQQARVAAQQQGRRQQLLLQERLGRLVCALRRRRCGSSLAAWFGRHGCGSLRMRLTLACGRAGGGVSR